VFAPADFRILAPGKALPNKKILNGNVTPHGFRIRPGRDFLPYVVAGRYQEQIVTEREGAVIFWTVRPLDSRVGKIAASRIAATTRALEDFFGSISKGKFTVHVVEAPGELPSEFSERGDEQEVATQAVPESLARKSNSAPGGGSFPQGVLLDSRAIAQGVGDEAVLQLIEYELARTWFGWRVRPFPGAQILMGRGAGMFGLAIAAEARGLDLRRSMIESLLNRYDAARAIAPDKRLMESPFGYSRAERISTGYRAALFLVALEDLCGRDNLREAFREIVRSRSGDEAGYEELRAALESASKRDLAQMFREWLNRPGVPEEFRARYARR